MKTAIMGVSDGVNTTPLGELFKLLQKAKPPAATNSSCVAPALFSCVEPGNAPIRGIQPEYFVVGQAAFQVCLLLASMAKSACVKYRSAAEFYPSIQDRITQAFGKRGLVAVQVITLAALLGVSRVPS